MISDRKQLILKFIKILEDKHYKEPDLVSNPGCASGLAGMAMFNPESTESIARIAELEKALTQAKTQNLQLTMLKHQEKIQEAIENGDLEVGDDLDSETRAQMLKDRLKGKRQETPEEDLINFDLEGTGAFKSPLGKFVAGSLLYGVSKYLSRKLSRWLGRTALGRAYRIPKVMAQRRYIHLMNSMRRSSRRLMRSAMKHNPAFRVAYRTLNKGARRRFISRTRAKIVKPINRVAKRMVKAKPIQQTLRFARRANLIRKGGSKVTRVLKKAASKSLGKLAGKGFSKGASTVLRKVPILDLGFVGYDLIQAGLKFGSGDTAKGIQYSKDAVIDAIAVIPLVGTALSIALTIADANVGQKYTDAVMNQMSPLANGYPIDITGKAVVKSETEKNNLYSNLTNSLGVVGKLSNLPVFFMDLIGGKLFENQYKFKGSDINYAYYLPSGEGGVCDEDIVAGYVIKNGNLVKKTFDVPLLWRGMVQENLEETDFPMSSDLVYYKLSDIKKKDPEEYDRLVVNIDNWVRLKQSGIDTNQLSVTEAMPLSGTLRTPWGEKIIDGSTALNGRVLLHTTDGMWLDSAWKMYDQQEIADLFNFSDNEEGYAEGGFTRIERPRSTEDGRVIGMYSISNMEKYNSNIRKAQKRRDQYHKLQVRKYQREKATREEANHLSGFSRIVNAIWSGIKGGFRKLVNGIQSVGSTIKSAINTMTGGGNLTVEVPTFIPDGNSTLNLGKDDNHMSFTKSMYNLLYEVLSSVNFIDSRDIGRWATLLTAQAAQESNWGKSGLSRKYNNFSGMTKGTAKYRCAGTVNMNNKQGTDPNCYAVFASPADWAYDYVHYLHRKWDAFSKGVEGFVGQLFNNPKHPGQRYGTDPNYASTLSSMIGAVTRRLEKCLNGSEKGASDIKTVATPKAVRIARYKPQRASVGVIPTQESITQEDDVVLLRRNNSTHELNLTEVNNFYEE